MGRWETLHWLAVAYMAFLALLFIGLPALVVALILKASPRPALRRLARVLLAADATTFAVMIGAGAGPLLSNLWQGYGTYRRTYHLTDPRVLAGVSFPASSTVYLNEDGSIARGTLPVPAVIAGLPLVGEFGTEGWGPAYKGTLAAPFEVEGVPCKAGQVWWLPGARVSCVLDRGYTFAGHDLAAGTRITLNILTTGERHLEAGTLSHPELLFNVLWPAGSVLGSTSATATPERLAHGSVPEGERVDLCLMSGETVSIPGATLHGTITYSVKGEQRRVTSGCYPALEGPLMGPRYPDDGYVEVGADRYVEGRRQGADLPWRWDDSSPSDQAF